MMFDIAKQEYRDVIAKEVYRRAVEGVQEPVIGGVFKDEVVIEVTKYSDRLLELEAKRVDPSYRERQQVDMNVSGGVMILNAQPTSEEEWGNQYGVPVTEKEEAQKEEEKKVIDVTPSEEGPLHAL